MTGNRYVGGLVGFNYSGITSNSYATGIVVGNGNYVGGLVGWNEDVPITNSHASVNVTGNGDSTGGLVGHHHNSTISNSYATGTVTGQHDDTGGLVGRSDSGTINNSYATGNVVGYGNYAGGLLGHNDGIIENSYATGNVVGYSSYVGGLTGINDIGGHTINNSYATGNVEGHGDYVGGLAGTNYGDITNSYARGVVTGSGSDVGALVGNDDGDIYNSFYELGVNPLLSGVGNHVDAAGYVWGLSTVDMKLEANFNTPTAANGNVDPGWDYTPGTGDWKIDPAKNGGYPYLAWQTFNSDVPDVPPSDVPDVPSKFLERPVLSEPLPVTDPSYQGAPIAPTGPLVPEGQLLEAKIVNPPSGSAPGLILVMVPQSLGVEGSVFSFVLPEEVKNAVTESGVAEKVTLLDGSLLPSWLHYDFDTMTFTATDMPQGLTEFKVLVKVGGKSWVVDITMQHAP